MHRKMIYGAHSAGGKGPARNENDCARTLEQRPRKPAHYEERKNERTRNHTHKKSAVQCSAVFAATLSPTCTTIPDTNRTTKKNDGPQ